MNSQPMGFYAPAQLVRDARAHGATVLPIDVNVSDWDHTLEPQESRGVALRLGMRLISGLGRRPAESILQARANRPFESTQDLAHRAGLSPSLTAALAKGDAFGSLGLSRRAALWRSLDRIEKSPLFADATDAGAEEDSFVDRSLPAMSEYEEVLADYRSIGLSIKGHPIGFVRSYLNHCRATPAIELAQARSGSFVRVAGVVLMRQRPSTANGIRFVTLEDETGVANLIIRPKIWERYHRPAGRAAALMAYGRLERKGEVVHLLVSQVRDLSAVLMGLRPKSRDFR
jgi:error-prone DNA polymerase